MLWLILSFRQPDFAVYGYFVRLEIIAQQKNEVTSENHDRPSVNILHNFLPLIVEELTFVI
jgi:hypothetical protein